ncbi:MAG: hypothetical protein V3S98_06240 [Dehalococcoidia bacterium]
MIDVIVPVHYQNVTQAVFGCLTHLADHTDVPLRFIIAGRGGARDDWEMIRDWLDQLRDEAGLHYGILATDSAIGNNWAAVAGVLDMIKHDHVFICNSSVLINDDLWFTKMRAPINQAPYVGGVFLPAKFGGSSTLEPHPLNDIHDIVDSAALLTTRAYIQMASPMPPGDSFSEQFQRALIPSGATRWSHPGVNFEVRSESANWSHR